jgi:hypothetical protein
LSRSANVEEINRGQADGTTVKSSLLNIEPRSEVVNYAGHGRPINGEVTCSLQPTPGRKSLSLVFSMTCLNGFSGSLARALPKFY